MTVLSFRRVIITVHVHLCDVGHVHNPLCIDFIDVGTNAFLLCKYPLDEK